MHERTSYRSGPQMFCKRTPSNLRACFERLANESIAGRATRKRSAVYANLHRFPAGWRSASPRRSPHRDAGNTRAARTIRVRLSVVVSDRVLRWSPQWFQTRSLELYRSGSLGRFCAVRCPNEPEPNEASSDGLPRPRSTRTLA